MIRNKNLCEFPYPSSRVAHSPHPTISPYGVVAECPGYGHLSESGRDPSNREGHNRLRRPHHDDT